MDHWILDGHTPVRCDLMTWARWYEQIDNRRVAYTQFPGGYVSTVFLGIDHGFGFGHRLPVLFETMVFGGPHDGYQERYCTWDEAALGHEVAVNIVQIEVTAQAVRD